MNSPSPAPCGASIISIKNGVCTLSYIFYAHVGVFQTMDTQGQFTRSRQVFLAHKKFQCLAFNYNERLIALKLAAVDKNKTLFWSYDIGDLRSDQFSRMEVQGSK